MSKILFKEIQKANLSWKWVLFIALYILMIWALYEQIEMQDLAGMIAIVFSITVIIIFNIIITMMKLETEIGEKEIRFRFIPFHKSSRKIKWIELSDFYIRDYKPLREYGGYGIQQSLRNGKAYSISGKTGIQLIKKDGKKIIIGTQKPKELERVLKLITKTE